MANYTIELRHVVENHNIFNFNYTFYDENERVKFENNFIRHFYFREIGSETIDRFIWNLQDKFATVFPYYNELFKATQIEYSVLDNYNLTETITREQQNKGKSSGVSSTVGQVFDNHQTDERETLNVRGDNTRTENGTSETVHNGTSETSGTGKENRESSGTITREQNAHSETTNSGTNLTENTITETVEGENSNTQKVEGTTTKNGSSSGTSSEETSKKFLDTPQGLTDLSNSNYITTLNHDETDGSTETESTETATNTETTTGSGTNKTTSNRTDISDGNTTDEGSANSSESESTETSENGETTTENNSKTTVSDNSTGSTEIGVTENSTVSQDSDLINTFTGEQKRTEDNNTRTQSEGSQTESIKTVRKGNIGVDTDADMLQKHIKLQEILKKIELMFFDECEDLFMGVY